MGITNKYDFFRQGPNTRLSPETFVREEKVCSQRYQDILSKNTQTLVESQICNRICQFIEWWFWEQFSGRFEDNSLKF